MKKSFSKMTETYPVFRLTQEAYDQLRLAAEEDPNSYLNPDADFTAVLQSRGLSNYVENTAIPTTCPIVLTPVTDAIGHSADQSALDLSTIIEGMTLSGAAH